MTVRREKATRMGGRSIAGGMKFTVLARLVVAIVVVTMVPVSRADDGSSAVHKIFA